MGTLSYLTESEARAQLRDMVAAESDPALDEATLDRLISTAKRPSPLSSAQLVFLGDDQLDPALRNALVLSCGLRLDRPLAIPPDGIEPWQPGKVYALGDHANPTLINGYRYVVSVAGTSGATEPTWPTSGKGATVTDGGVTWTLDGLAWVPTWDLNAAAAEGWRIKAGKAASRASFSSAGSSYQRNQVWQMCMEMAKAYAKKRLVSVTIASEHPRTAGYLQRSRDF